MRRLLNGRRDLPDNGRRRENTATPEEWKISHSRFEGREMDGCCFGSGGGGIAEEGGRQMDDGD